MKQLQLNSFIASDKDIEINQYKILAGIKAYRNEFRRYKLYPSLAEIVYLSSQLEEIYEKKNGSTVHLPKSIKTGKMNDKSIIVEIVDKPAVKNDYFYDLIKWALPILRELIDEAYIIYDFAEANINIIEIGKMPEFKDHGYLFIPDNINSNLQILRFECPVYYGGSKPFYSLKTKFVQFDKLPIFTSSLEGVKQSILKKYAEKDDTAAYYCRTDLEFPIYETILPLVKRKLLSRLSA